MERVERLTAELEALIPTPRRAGLAEQLVGAVLELHGEGLAQVLEIVDEDTARALADDGVVASLMLIHDLYPVPLDERVMEALDNVRPYMESHGGNVELLGVEDGVAAAAPRRQLQRLLGLVGHAGAGDQEGADGDRARPARAGGRGHRRGCHPRPAGHRRHAAAAGRERQRLGAGAVGLAGPRRRGRARRRARPPPSRWAGSSCSWPT